ncbi:N-6 DNA methylase [Mannheimia pernigra]|uniref:N-6 DNA methylase n=1 Tax=Mannheimia pernigra TaxID=111844 RepID=UPI001318E9F7|nr:N-6 DNA methylase [Mannheimia pernigra]QHB18252.1 N-6 DNA methylase [Mannheimia pernigra]
MKTYIRQIKKAINAHIESNIRIKESYIAESSNTIANYLPAELRKKLGAFFTDTQLSEKAIRYFQQAITAESVVLDPNCGIGNLLLESSRQLGVYSHLSDTLKTWGRVLRGFDIQEDFIELTKLRLIMAALIRGVKADCSLEQAMSYFKYIIQQDSLTVSALYLNSVTHLFMNPPFIAIQSPKRDYWRKGKTNSAAVFFDYYLRNVPDKCNVVAILPDVLRSGSRFKHFRDFVSENLRGRCDIIGRFSDTVDVDIFILSGQKCKDKQDIIWSTQYINSNNLGEQYDVCIGPLVAYRDKIEGNTYPYFHPKNCKTWGVITAVSETREFNGKVIQPPCVLIKRTSSPSDKYRAAATLINLKQPIAVENHLIVVTPKDKSLKGCKRLLKMLARPEVNQFLNEQIRLRHLTVGVIKSIPIY